MTDEEIPMYEPMNDNDMIKIRIESICETAPAYYKVSDVERTHTKNSEIRKAIEKIWKGCKYCYKMGGDCELKCVGELERISDILNSLLNDSNESASNKVTKEAD